MNKLFVLPRFQSNRKVFNINQSILIRTKPQNEYIFVSKIEI
jgi:hypothetical protein